MNRRGGHLTGTYVRSLTPILHHELVSIGVATSDLAEITWLAPEDPAATD